MEIVAGEDFQQAPMCDVGDTEHESCGICVRRIALAGQVQEVCRSEQFMPRLEWFVPLHGGVLKYVDHFPFVGGKF